jgi:hypothetical protein
LLDRVSLINLSRILLVSRPERPPADAQFQRAVVGECGSPATAKTGWIEANICIDLFDRRLHRFDVLANSEAKAPQWEMAGVDSPILTGSTIPVQKIRISWIANAIAPAYFTAETLFDISLKGADRVRFLQRQRRL